jgi:hypothetical protein
MTGVDFAKRAGMARRGAPRRKAKAACENGAQSALLIAGRAWLLGLGRPLPRSSIADLGGVDAL